MSSRNCRRALSVFVTDMVFYLQHCFLNISSLVLVTAMYISVCTYK